MENEKHIWYFPSKGLKALFDEEICGQLSDGAWENSMPYKHWYFWCHLATEVGPKWDFKFNKNTDYREKYPQKKTGYNLVGALLDPEVIDLSSRMRAYYVGAELGLGLGRDAECLLNDGIENIRKHASAPLGDYWKQKLAKLEAIPAAKLEEFNKAYAEYTRKDLIKDLKLIKQQMKVVVEAALKN